MSSKVYHFCTKKSNVSQKPQHLCPMSLDEFPCEKESALAYSSASRGRLRHSSSLHKCTSLEHSVFCLTGKFQQSEKARQCCTIPIFSLNLQTKQHLRKFLRRLLYLREILPVMLFYFFLFLIHQRQSHQCSL